MSVIIAGRFQTQAETDLVMRELHLADFRIDEVSSFYLNPPGQHALYPVGGDAHHDEGTTNSGKTAAAGGTLGAAAGVAVGAAVAVSAAPATIAVAAAVAAVGVGSYVGSFVGAMAGTHAGNPRQASAASPVERAAGMMVAVCVDRPGSEESALHVLRANGAIELERAIGEWRDGSWSDFDPSGTPEFIDAPEGTPPNGPAG